MLRKKKDKKKNEKRVLKGNNFNITETWISSFN